MQTALQAIQSFRNNFGKDPHYVCYAPGKINILGEHLWLINETAIEATINAGIYIAFAENAENTTHVVNVDTFEQLYISTQNVEVTTITWKALIQKTLQVIATNNKAEPSLSILIEGNLPPEKALYYYAALVIGLLAAANNYYNWQKTNLQLATIATNICNAVDKHYYSITDFLTIIEGSEQGVVKVNPVNGHAEIIEIPTGECEWVITKMNVPIVQQEDIWEQRKEELINGLSFFKTIQRRINSFSEISSKVAEQFAASMDDDSGKRSLYITAEMERVQLGVESILNNNFAALGQLLFQSHRELAELFETSTPYINYVVTESKLHSSCWGSKQLAKDNYMLSLVQPFSSAVITTHVVTSFKSVHQQQAIGTVYAFGKGWHTVTV